MTALYTQGLLAIRTAAQFASYSDIRVSAQDLTSGVVLQLAAAGAVDVSAQLGDVAVTFTGSNGDDTVVTGAGNDALYGGLGRDSLYGGLGDDSFSAGFGDTVYGDAFYGGGGNDSFSLREFDVAGGVAVFGGDGFDTLVMDGPYQGPDMPGFVLTGANSIEQVYGTFVDATTRHNAVFDLGEARFIGRASLAGHDDYFRALYGEYDVFGGAGDTVIGSDGVNQIWAVTYAEAGGGADGLHYVAEAYGGEGDDWIDGAVHAYGGAGKDNIRGSQNVDAGDGDDTVTGGLTGAVFGGAGTDLFVLNGSLGGAAVHFAATDRMGDFESYALAAATLSDFDDVVDFTGAVALKTSVAVTVNAGAGRDEVRTGAGNQVLDGGSGIDTLAGGAGDDTYYLDTTGDRVIEAVGGGTDRVILTASYTFAADLANIERFEVAAGLSGATITGAGLADVIYAGAGANSVYGGGGNDVLWGSGHAQLFGWDGDDVLHTEGCMGNGGSGNDRLLGGTLADTLNGGSGNDLLQGGAGADQLIGGYGDDIFLMDASDTITEVNYGGHDEVRIVAQVIDLTLISAYVEDAVGLAAIASTISGNALANHLTGTAQNDTLDGRSGADTLTGGKGDDLYYVNSIDDRIQELTGQGTDSVISTAFEYHLDAWVEIGVVVGAGSGLFGNELNNVLSSQGGNALFGGGGTDTLIGGADSDTIDGGTGADVMNGGDGRDYYFVDQRGDRVIDTGVDSDRVITSLTNYRLTDGLEELYAANTAASTLIGNALDNTLVGNAGADSLRGGDGRDVLDGGVGRDVLTGGNGTDFFVFDTQGLAANRDTINDFGAEDVIVLENTGAGLFTGLADGALDQAFFRTSGALDSDDRILYHKASGVLSYDADGSGAGQAVVFAVIANHATPTAANILVL